MNTHGTKEWAVHSLNICLGCKHGCLYCYGQTMATRFGKLEGRDWTDEVVLNERLNAPIKMYKGRIMYPSVHDITPQHLQESVSFIEKILVAGNSLLIVSKPHLECIRAICGRSSAYRDKILFRFTMGSADSSILKFWEPNAPDFNERLASLKHAFDQGYMTSISCEPMLDNNIAAVIDQVASYVTDSIWLGKANRLMVNLSLNGHRDPETMKRAKELLSWQSDAEIKALYERYKANPMIKWKESIKKVVGIELATVAGLDQ